MTRRFILWDIDGTLVRGARVVAEAYRSALRAIYRLEGEIASISYAGKTDGQIALETLAHHGLREDAVLPLLESFREAYTDELERMRHRLVEEIEVLPGVLQVLEELQARGAHQSLLTGNFEATARIKLASAGLDRYFDFSVGAFGSDHRDRNSLVPMAVAKAQASYGIAFSAGEVVVVGDTPRDIECARAGGARVVAVATGTVLEADLRRHAPDALLPDLADTRAAVEAVLGNRPGVAPP